MEKRRPHCDLEAFKAVCGEPETLALTGVASNGAAELKMHRIDVAHAVKSMNGSMFVKSMTSYNDYRVSQDVYHVPIPGGRNAYVKFRNDVITQFVILSFKDRDHG